MPPYRLYFEATVELGAVLWEVPDRKASSCHSCLSIPSQEKCIEHTAEPLFEATLSYYALWTLFGR